MLYKNFELSRESEKARKLQFDLPFSLIDTLAETSLMNQMTVETAISYYVLVISW